jgi:Xaa-Pro dipeptidase
MPMLSRRSLLAAASAAPVAALAADGKGAAPELISMTASAKPIAAEERRARIDKAQRLMAEQKIAALLIESGASLDYFTGIRWWRSERTTAAILPAAGEVIVVTPAFEEPSVRETLQVEGEVRPWDEHENPFERIVQALKDHNAAAGRLAVESTTRFFIVDGIRKASNAYDVVSGDAVVRPCRMIKSPAELALMQLANQVTLAALAHVHDRIAAGMSQSDITAMMVRATIALGGRADGGLALLNEASAYPHGSVAPQRVREGSTILMDCGCSVHGYQSDISRSWVWGEPSAKQRKVWQTVKRGQEIALETAKIGLPVGKIDEAVRGFYEKEGWGPGYHLPGLPHRTGHGIGMEGHEAAYLVRGDATPLAAGMCFSDEPGLYIPGEFGIRLEDCWHMTAAGPQLFTPFAKSLEQPI